MSKHYAEILYHCDTLPSANLNKLLREHEIWCMARMIKEKFQDTRTVDEICSIVHQELGI